MEAVMDQSTVAEIITRFQALQEIVPLKPIHSDQEYDLAVQTMNQLLDAGAADENSVLAALVNSLGSLIGDYDDLHYRAPVATPIATLQFLMRQHNLNQSDLPEIGTQGVVSELLSGIREFNVRQIKALAERFNVPASIFLK